MITIQKIINTRINPNEERVLGEFAGLSTDAKPTEWSNKSVDNGSVFREIDTGKNYMFDYQNQRWIVQDGGGSGGNIQPSKSVEYTSNDTYAVVPDEGYDGIATTYVNVNVPSSVNNETQSVSITSNDTYVYTPSSGYTGIDSITVDVNVPSSGGGIDLTSGIRFGYSNFSYLPSEIINANWTSITDLGYRFYYCQSLLELPLIDTSTIESMDSSFTYCSALTELPQFDTVNVESMNYMCQGCSSLTTVPVLNTSNVISLIGAFEGCSNLSNTSLDNIMEMCINTSLAYTQPKTLANLGISATQAEICKTLSNYSDFVSAGWATGYEVQVEVDIPAIIALAGTGTDYTLSDIGVLDGYLFNYGITLTLNDTVNQQQIVGTINWQTFTSNDSTLTFDINYNSLLQGNEYYFYNIQYNPQQ